MRRLHRRLFTKRKEQKREKSRTRPRMEEQIFSSLARLLSLREKQKARAKLAASSLMKDELGSVEKVGRGREGASQREGRG